MDTFDKTYYGMYFDDRNLSNVLATVRMMIVVMKPKPTEMNQ